MFPAAVTACQCHRGGLADMANAERVNKALQRNVAPRFDGIEQVAHRDFAEAFDVFETIFLLRSSSMKRSAGSLTHSFS